MIRNIKPFFSSLTFLWVTAFICALYPVNAWQLGWFAACVLILFGWGAIVLTQTMERGWNLPRTPVVALAGAFWLLVFASVFWSDIKPVSLMGLCFFSVFPLSFFIFTAADREDTMRMAVRAVAVILAVLAVWAAIQFFFLNLYFSGQARHPLADPSSLGAIFSLGFFCGMGWLLVAREKCSRKYAVIFSSLMLCGIISTVARGPVFAMLPVLGVMAVLLWPQVKANKKAVAAVFAIALAFYGLTQTNLSKRLDIGSRLMGHGMEDVSNNRMNIWGGALEIAKESPLLGKGIGTFFLYYPEHRSVEDHTGAFLVHNDPLQFWVELGILGPLLFYGFLLAAALRTFRALSRLKGDEHSDQRIKIISIMCALAAMAIHSHVGFNHYNLSILMLNGLLLAIWLRATSSALAEPPRVIAMPESLPKPALKILILLPFVMLGWMMASISAGEHFVNRARDNLFKQEMGAFADNINKAGRVSMDMNSRAYLLAVNVPMTILEIEGRRLSDDEKAQLNAQVQDYMGRVLALNPRDSSAHYYLGRARLLSGADGAAEDFERAIAMDPAHLGARMELYKIYLLEARPLEEQIAVLEGALKYYLYTPLAGEFYDMAMAAYIREGNYDKLKEVQARAAEFTARSEYSRIRRNTPIPQAVMGGDEIFREGR